jgi:hypothetical protein
MAVMLGGSKAVQVGIRHGVAYAYQYVNEEPALVLWNPKQPLGSGAFIIALSSAFKYADDEYLIRQSALAAQQLGFSITKYDVMNIAKVIEISIDDLVHMPPEPEEQKHILGEAEITLGGQTFVFEFPEDPTNVH